MKKIRQMLLISALAVSTAACAPDRESDQSGATQEAGALPEELLVWAPDGEISAIEDQASRFTDETGINVRVVPFGQADQTEAIVLDGPAGKGPDLFFQPGVGNLAVQGLVQPMEVAQEILDTYSNGSLDALSYEGELYGLPAVVESLALYYNKELVPEAPETMEELEQIAESLTDDANDEFGFLYPVNDFYFSYPFMAGYGAYILGEEGEDAYDLEDVGLANEGGVQGASLIQGWFEKEYMPVGITMDVTNGLFSDGKVGAIINGPWARYDFEEALGENLGTAPLPQLDNGEYPQTFLGTKGWMLSAYSEHPEEATELAVYFTNEDSLKEYFESTGEIPANSAILASEEFLNNPILNGFAVQLERAKPFPNVAALSAVWQPMADALTFITQGDDVKETLEDGVSTIEQDIEMNYKQ
ncbi:extracellular solute-binding protein [Jeotgalibacillus proteolyticus]|uniref:Maltodextrin-binding protein n=1 Tax=Jeotgalibacillus proteolyticus TaxID=2082395 RepID=A0A2S5GDF6_9BACL|nr:extracellular solute-binding protein [Jeotgalibacillus proteolyticus]PPA71072.1 ABC transporter substrate-binding protein [Jeotgalibacillus proteolyticus]